MSRQINSKGLALIKFFESCELSAYKCPAGIWTIGWGTTTGIQPGMKISQTQADFLLSQDLALFEQGVSNLVKVSLTDNQFSALVCFAYNVGINALASSTLLKKLNAKDMQGATSEFIRWNKASGMVQPGLTRRRKAERKLFLS